jgi:hypothetical protein
MARDKFQVDAEAVTVRMSSSVLRSLDEWCRKQADRPERTEAICRLVEQALTSADTRPMATDAQHKAAEMAFDEIDKLGTNVGQDEEHAQRKRRLIKGPSEFREIRAKRAKRKK